MYQKIKELILSINDIVLKTKWTVSNNIRSFYIDRKLGIATCKEYEGEKEISTKRDSVAHSPTLYSEIQRMIDYLKFKKNDVFIDFGCGKGRVIFLVATQRLKNVVGIEFNPRLANIAKKNLNNLKPQFNQTPVELIAGDALGCDVKEGTVFYMFNPFGLDTFTGVIEKIRESLKTHRRAIRIVYRNPVYIDVLNDINWLIPEGQIDRTEIFVWRNKISETS